MKIIPYIFALLFINFTPLKACQSCLTETPPNASIMKAVKANHYWATSFYLMIGYSPDTLDDHRWSLLHWAAYLGYEGIVSRLLNAGAHPQVLDNGYRAPLHWAVIQGHLNCVKLLIAAGANAHEPVATTLRTPLLLAIKYYRFDIVNYLLSVGADIFDIDYQYITALYFLSPGGRVQQDAIRENLNRMALIFKNYLNRLLDSYTWGQYLKRIREQNITTDQKLIRLQMIIHFLESLNDYFGGDAAFMAKVALALAEAADLLNQPGALEPRPSKNPYGIRLNESHRGLTRNGLITNCG